MEGEEAVSDLTRINISDPVPCDCCGGGPTEWRETLGLYICVRCMMPENANATETEWQAWRALMRFSAGKRELERLGTYKVSAWFFERYERLGLVR